MAGEEDEIQDAPRLSGKKARQPAYFRTWLRRVAVWRGRVARTLPKPDQAGWVLDQLDYDAFIDLEDLDAEALMVEDGLGQLLDILRGVYA